MLSHTFTPDPGYLSCLRKMDAQTRAAADAEQLSAVQSAAAVAVSQSVSEQQQKQQSAAEAAESAEAAEVAEVAAVAAAAAAAAAAQLVGHDGYVTIKFL